MKANGKKLGSEMNNKNKGKITSEMNSDFSDELSSDIDFDTQSKGRVKKVFRSTVHCGLVLCEIGLIMLALIKPTPHIDPQQSAIRSLVSTWTHSLPSGLKKQVAN